MTELAIKNAVQISSSRAVHGSNTSALRKTRTKVALNFQRVGIEMTKDYLGSTVTLQKYYQ